MYIYSLVILGKRPHPRQCDVQVTLLDIQFMQTALFDGCIYSLGTPTRIPRKNLHVTKFDVNTNTDYLKIARKGGGHKGNSVN